jgi:type I restriction enzyme, S subunit
VTNSPDLIKRGWKECKLGEIITLEYGKSLNDYKDISGFYPVYGTNGKIGETDSYLSSIPSVIIGRKGAYRGVHFSRSPFFVIDTAFYIKPKINDIDLFFLYNFLLTQDINSMDSGSAIPSTDRYEIYDINIFLPPLPEQRAIAGVLSSFDDKIDLLHRQNKTMEAMAETLWRKMFVEDADPNWKKGKLGDIGQIICGKTPSKKNAEYFNGSIPFIKIPDMHGNVFIIKTEDSLSELGMYSQQNKTIPARSICVSCIATVGLVSMNTIASQTNQQINTIIPSKEFYLYFIFLLVRNMTDDLIARASGGTATLNLNTGDFSNIEIITPPDEIIQRSYILLKDYFEKIYTNSFSIIELSNIRNILLPKLMSGEVRVKHEINSNIDA